MLIFLLRSCKHNNTSLSLMVGITVTVKSNSDFYKQGISIPLVGIEL